MEVDRKCINEMQRDYRVNGYQYSSDERGVRGKAQRAREAFSAFFIELCVFIEMIKLEQGPI